MATKIQFRRDISTNWASINPILSQGELGIEIDTMLIKIGDGIMDWNTLSYHGGPVDSVNGKVGVVTLDTGDILDIIDKRYVTDLEKTNITHSNRSILDLITSAFTTTLKSLYDLAYTHSLITTGNPHGTTKTDLLLGNVDNTTDLLKPVSTATQTKLNLKEDISNKGIAGGYASLDGGGKVPSTQLPAYVDDVLEFANFISLPAIGETGKIYVILDTNLEYRWSGSIYIQIAKGPVDSVNGKVGVVTLNQDEIPDGTTYKQVSSTEKIVWNGKQNALGFTPENISNKDATGGYAGLTLFKINFKNALNTFTSFFTNSNTASRTYTFPDNSGTIMLLKDNFGPQGFATDYMIVRTVASGNLTVALKHTDGTDATVALPIYVRIGNTVKSVTSALSLTQNATQNFSNAGSTELATKEIDFFVYLGWSTISSSVVIGYGRTVGRIASDFSGTVANEKWNYLAYSGICNATDEVECIGRFNAILSAGAGYTWSIPATSIIINRPIYETRNLSVVTTDYYNAGVSMTSYSSVQTNYRIVGGIVFFEINRTIETLPTTIYELGFDGLPFTTNSDTRTASFWGYNGGGINFVYGATVHPRSTGIKFRHSTAISTGSYDFKITGYYSII